jgi:hypothetical protein
VLVHVQLATLAHTKHTYMWVKSKNTTYMWVKSKNTTYMWAKSKNTTSCMQQNASTEYKSATNKTKQLYKAF